MGWLDFLFFLLGHCGRGAAQGGRGAPCLSYLAAWQDGTVGGDDAQRAVVVHGRENHALADEAVLEGAGCEVGDEAHLFADEVLGFVVLGNACLLYTSDAADD